MKKQLKNSKIFCTIIFLISCSFFSNAQFQRTAHAPIKVKADICIYKPDPNPKKVTVPISDIIRAKINSRDAGCSTFEVTYNGFTPEAEAAFQYAVDIWSNIIQSSVPIKVNANFSELDDGVLGAAGASGFYGLSDEGNGLPVTFFPAALADALIGEDLDADDEDPIGYDIGATFSSTFPFYFGTDGNPPANKYDFVTVVLHELGHGLGFTGFAHVDDNDMPTEGAVRFSNVPSMWDRFIENDEMTPILDFTDPSVALLTEFTSNALRSNSPEAVDQNEDEEPKIYAPEEWDGGSSYSHWDESTFPAGNAHALMTPFVGAGEAIHDPGKVTLGFMEDMYWSLCTSLGIDNHSFLGLEIHPNPVENRFEIRLPLKYANAEYKVQVMDLNGRVIQTKKAKGVNNKINIDNLDRLDKAMYFVKITNTENHESIVKKIIKK